jgi:hypothetical protein
LRLKQHSLQLNHKFWVFLAHQPRQSDVNLSRIGSIEGIHILLQQADRSIAGYVILAAK